MKIEEKGHMNKGALAQLIVGLGMHTTHVRDHFLRMVEGSFLIHHKLPSSWIWVGSGMYEIIDLDATDHGITLLCHRIDQMYSYFY